MFLGKKERKLVTDRMICASLILDSSLKAQSVPASKIYPKKLACAEAQCMSIKQVEFFFFSPFFDV